MRGAKPERALEIELKRNPVLVDGATIVVACSGGPDSVALAAALTVVARGKQLRLVLGHINHGIRHSAWQDEAVVLRLAAALNLRVRVVALDPGGSDEASMRARRYEALGAIAHEVGARFVATAHSAEDQTETVLLALFRGTGLEGLAGMPIQRELVPGIELIRPFLRVDRAELRAYCHGSGLPYALDPTNMDLGYRRNAVRAALHDLRPIFPGLDRAVARAAEVARAEVNQDDRAALRRRVRVALRAEDGLSDIGFAHIEAVVRTLERSGSGRFPIKSGIELVVEGGTIRVQSSL